MRKKKFPKLLQGERGNVGVFPIFETGGETGAAYVLLLFHRNLLNTGHKVRGEFLLGSRDFNDFELEYDIPGLFMESDNLEFKGTYFNDPAESLFRGNSAALDEVSRFWIEEGGGSVEYSRPFRKKAWFVINTEYRNVTIRQSNFRASEDFFNPFPQLLKGNIDLLSFNSSFEIDFAKGEPRTYLGPRFKLGLGYNHSLDNDQFEYLNYRFEWHQFLPLPFGPNTRRFAFRTVYRRVEPLRGKEVPFFEFRTLGSSRDLRGFDGDRFRDDGSLLLTLEYRYPMWDFIDIVLFVDEGQVFDRMGGLSIDDFHTSYGFGTHILGNSGLAFRLEFAFSRETMRSILTIRPNF